MLLRTKLPTNEWGYAVLHAATLMRIRPTTCNSYSLQQLVVVKESNISHIRIFGCAIYMLIAPPNCRKIDPQCGLGIYVGYDSPLSYMIFKAINRRCIYYKISILPF